MSERLGDDPRSVTTRPMPAPHARDPHTADVPGSR